MTINLSDLSDAQLGKLLRRSMTDEAMARYVVEAPKGKVRKQKKKVEAKRLQVNEQMERSAMEAWQGFTLAGIEIPTLSLNEVPWHEAAPNTVQDTYRRAMAAMGMPYTSDEPMTWRDCKGVHLTLMGNYVLPDEVVARAKVLADVAKISLIEAIDRVLNVRPDEPVGEYVWTKDPMDVAEPVSGKRTPCPATFQGQRCKREHNAHVVHLGEGARTFRKA